MNPVQLTQLRAGARGLSMQERSFETTRIMARLPLLMAGMLALGGCITVNAPEEPIVIELNINIRQEVIYRLASDVRENIDENPDIF